MPRDSRKQQTVPGTPAGNGWQRWGLVEWAVLNERERQPRGEARRGRWRSSPCGGLDLSGAEGLRSPLGGTRAEVRDQQRVASSHVSTEAATEQLRQLRAACSAWFASVNGGLQEAYDFDRGQG